MRSWTIPLALSLTLILGACANGRGGSTASGGGGGLFGGSCKDPSLSAAERQLCEDNSTFNETMLGGAATGAAAGAALGALGCWAAGEDPLACAAVGAVAGGALGAIDGYVTAKQQEATRQQVRAIDLVTDDLKRENAQIARSVQNARTVVADSESRLAKAEADLKAGKITAAQAETERANVARNRERLDKLVADLEERRQNYAEASTKTGDTSPDFNRQMAELQTNITSLKGQRDKLTQSLAVRGA